MLRTLFHRRDLAFVVGALVVLGGVWGVPRSLAAGDSVRMDVDGPAELTTPSVYKIAMTGDRAKVCRIQETTTETSDKSAPFGLEISPENLPVGASTLVFQAVACDNTLLGTVKETVEVPVHIDSVTDYVAPVSTDDAAQRFSLRVAADQGPLRARITRGGRTVTTLAGSDTAKGSWKWTPGANPAGAYVAEVTDGDGHTLTVPFTVTSGWAPLGKPFPRCQLLTWSYSSTDEPARAAGIEGDIGTAFTKITRATGIRFKHVAKNGTIQLGWKDMGVSGPDGEGGAFWSGNYATSGRIVFNTRSTWVGKAGFKRYDNDFPGRGSLITHEIGHSLGLGHVTDREEIMYPVATDGSPLGLQKGDRAGLNALYHARSC